MKDKKKREGRGKWQFLRIVIIRIIVLAAVVVGYSLPMPWRIIVPLSIGAVTILIETIACFKRPKEENKNAQEARKATRKKDNKKAA